MFYARQQKLKGVATGSILTTMGEQCSKYVGVDVLIPILNLYTTQTQLFLKTTPREWTQMTIIIIIIITQ